MEKSIMQLLSTLRLATGMLLLAGVVGFAQADPDPKVLRVCADPNNLPLSDKAGHGYENRIAQLIGEELGRPLEYVWFPQRMGFIRNTLRAPNGSGGFKCDLVIGVPADYEMTANTRPYLHSAWTMVFADRPELAAVKSPEDVMTLPDEVRSKLRFGVFTHTPPLDWLFDHKLFDQAVPYPALSGDPDEIPGQIVAKDLAEGKIDVAMVWGPIGGYFAKQAKQPMRVVPFASTKELKFDYLLSLGVRHPDKEWRATLDAIIAKRQNDIDAILKEFGIPLLQISSPTHAAAAPGNS
jgi:quinoprotein dehydrogenase-associated probable ABC transporter substrate-binding protein